MSSDQDRAQTPECYRCRRVLRFGEVVYGVSVRAMMFEDPPPIGSGHISTLSDESELLVCQACAEQTLTHTIEMPFARHLKHFAT